MERCGLLDVAWYKEISRSGFRNSDNWIPLRHDPGWLELLIDIAKI